jgi:hypothetical protein
MAEGTLKQLARTPGLLPMVIAFLLIKNLDSGTAKGGVLGCGFFCAALKLSYTLIHLVRCFSGAEIAT